MLFECFIIEGSLMDLWDVLWDDEHTLSVVEPKDLNGFKWPEIWWAALSVVFVWRDLSWDVVKENNGSCEVDTEDDCTISRCDEMECCKFESTELLRDSIGDKLLLLCNEDNWGAGVGDDDDDADEWTAAATAKLERKWTWAAAAAAAAAAAVARWEQSVNKLRFNWFSSESDFTDKSVVRVDVDDPSLLCESYEATCSPKEFDGITSRSLWIDLLLPLSKLENSVKCLSVKLSLSVFSWRLIDELYWSNFEPVNGHKREGKFVDVDLLEGCTLPPIVILSEAVL